MSHSIPLSEIAQVNPPRPPLSVDAYAEVSFVPMGDVSESGRWDKRQVRRFSEVSRGYTYFAENDVLFAKITPCTENGKGCHAIGVRNGIGFASTEFHVLRANGTGDAGFVYQWSIYLPLRLKAAAVMTGSAGQQRMPASFFDSFEIPRIDKTEQSKIAEILSTVDRAIEQTEALIAKQQRIKTGLMQDLLTRGIDEQGNLRSEETDQFKDSPLGRISVEWDDPIQFEQATPKDAPICYGIVQPGAYDYTGVKVAGICTLNSDFHEWHMSSKQIEKAYGRRRIQSGDVLLSVKGTTGRVGVVPDGVTGNISRDLARIRPVSEISPHFLRCLMQSDFFQRYLGNAEVGTTRAELSIKILRDLFVLVPPRTEQDHIVDTIRSVEIDLEGTKTNLAKLRSLKTALMQDLLTGEKRVTPLLEPAVTT